MTSFLIALKSLRQLGLRPLVLYALYKLGLTTGHYKRAIPKTKPAITNYHSLFTLPDRAQLTSTLGEEGKATLLAQAEEIIAGKYRMFGDELVEIRLTGDWPLAHWTDFETRAVNYQLPTDIKFIWEPARFGWAFVLGRAYHLTQDDKYAESFWSYFQTFTESNPPNMGPHWMNGQEVAIRTMSFVWAAHVFETASATSAQRRVALHQSIANHASRIAQTLVYARSQNNNHLITEAAALYTAGLLLKNESWRALGWKWLNWSLQNQIGSFGEYIQHSTNYHRLMLQTALWVNMIKRDEWPRVTFQALARASNWFFSLLDLASGGTPNLGANDGALIFPLSPTPFNDFRPTVQAAARAFLKTQIESGIWDEMSMWLGLAPAMKTYEPEHYLSDNLRGKESWAYLRASTFKSRLSHMDQLHLDLWWRGLNVVQDAGTYSYNAEPPWDNPLVTTRIHNTVIVDGRDQMTRAGRFLMLDWVDAYSKSEIAAEENILQRLTAYHTGYRGIKHERTVTVYDNERWTVEDKLTRKHVRSHTYRLHWLFPDWEWEFENGESGIGIRLKSPYGWTILNVNLDAQTSISESRVSLIRAGKLIHGTGNALPYEGWFSPTYGMKLPALSFALEITSLFNTTFRSEFIFPK